MLTWVSLVSFFVRVSLVGLALRRGGGKARTSQQLGGVRQASMGVGRLSACACVCACASVVEWMLLRLTGKRRRRRGQELVNKWSGSEVNSDGGVGAM